ncbi:MAG: hypothetical protein WA421_19145 [Nitrososphaeraceae archaeon]
MPNSAAPVADNRKTVTMTFRVDEAIMTKLRHESEQREISLNTLVNQIFKHFVEWDVFESKVGMIPIARPIVVELFEKMTEDEIIEVAKRIGKNTVRDIALFMKNKVEIYSFLSWFEARMKSSFLEIKHDIENNNTHVYIVKHDLGKNWSLYHKAVLELIFMELLGRPIDVITTSTTLSFRIKG